MFDESVISIQQEEEHNPADELWKMALVLIKVARASGEVSYEKIANVRGACFGQPGEYISQEEAEEIEDSLIEWSEGDIPPLSVLLPEVIYSYSEEEKQDFMGTAVAVAMLDERITASERDILNELRDFLEIEEPLDSFLNREER